jgi:hypothetical protein
LVSPRRFVWKADLTSGLVKLALDPTERNSANRASLARYLSNFTGYFTEERLLPRLVQVCLGNHLSQSDGDFSDRLQTVAHFLQQSIGEESEDVRYWLWNISEDSPQFRSEHALLLLRALGIAKPAAFTLVESPVPEHPVIDHDSSLWSSSQPTPGSSVVPRDRIRLSAAGDIHGGATGREHLTNLLNDGMEPWSKWVHPGYVESSWIQADFEHPLELVGYGLCSANDCPHRDPLLWTLMGLPVGKSAASDDDWVPLHFCGGESDNDGPFTSRWQWLWFTFDVPTVVIAVRLEIHAVRHPGDCCQLGHFRLLESDK